ncbi:putative sexual development protein (LsdA) [Aspergillus ruber CBS 135680]|uniref:Putative sexual development protein n=1 Tax=Aspergillus ruber (strain CBS 135680) TaxID=1388766 RepID=A0A017SG46_ASPRC|nr:putative sexual development protein [Aspergillus ruber CBS 135680]EYE95726.1 putative sexual development protein [Aspergillus ruber CBS 135680]
MRSYLLYTNAGAPSPSRQVDFPLPDSLPNPSPSQIESIQMRAGGTLPNTPPPMRISSEGINNLKLMAFTGLSEVAFFDELLRNITTNVQGYQVANAQERDMVIKSLTTFLAQAELQTIAENNGLRRFNLNTVQPCHYSFPVSDYKSAIALGEAFTSLKLGALQDIVTRFAMGSDFDLARFATSIAGQKGQQSGWFRTLQNKVASGVPFPTMGNVDFLFSAVQRFIVPGNCSSIADISLRTLQPLNILTPPSPRTQLIRVSWKPTKGGKQGQLWMTYINQLNMPIAERMNIISSNNETVVAEALFPYERRLLNGLTIAAVTTSGGPFANAAEVSQATAFGPGLISVN